jgi:hypothetical protein
MVFIYAPIVTQKSINIQNSILSNIYQISKMRTHVYQNLPKMRTHVYQNLPKMRTHVYQNLPKMRTHVYQNLPKMRTHVYRNPPKMLHVAILIANRSLVLMVINSNVICAKRYSPQKLVSSIIWNIMFAKRKDKKTAPIVDTFLKT